MRRFKQRGSILLDGMIAILIFSIGILGMIAMQSASIAFSSNARYRTDAAAFADQILSQMWASAKNPALLPSFATGGAAFNTWAAQVEQNLPGATANPPVVTFNGTQVTVVVNWQLPSEGSTVHNYVSVSQIVL